MTENKPPGIPRKRQARGGPGRAQASREALAGVDLADLDPVQVLREVAADRSAPSASRVTAALALLRLGNAVKSTDGIDELTKRALQEMARRNQ